jgi:NodT family efflux transporter outer membrane factor (OMF) lipoprotein
MSNKLQRYRNAIFPVIPRACICLLAIAICGCASSPARQQRTPVAIPDTWAAPGSLDAAEPPAQWPRLFDDPALSRLIREALIRNHDLRLAATRIDTLHAEARLAGAPRLPGLDLEVTGQKGETPVEAFDQVSTEASQSVGVSLAMHWELDVWGRLGDRYEAAWHEIRAAEADWQAARLSLAGQVAKAWYQIIADRLLLRLVRDTLESYQINARIVRRHFESGLTGALDVRLALSNVAVAEDLLQDRANRFSQSKRTLQRLLQRYPDGELETATTLPVLGRAIPAGLPSQLLERRSDIRAAKQRLLAADRRISEAQKAFLPDIRLTADTGTSSEKLRNVVSADYLFWNLMANLTQPLFAGGRLKANLALTESAAQRAWLDYGNTVLTAFAEVELTLTAEHHLIRRLAAVEQAVDQAVAAETLALEAYTAGVADIITVLESQRRVLDSKADLIRIRRQQLQNRVDIYLALGGGFERISEET